MAVFCASFSWCDPDTFWNLDMDEYYALREVLAAQQKG